MGIRMHLSVGYGFNLAELPDLDPAMLRYERLKDGDLFYKWKVDVLAFAAKHDDLSEKLCFHQNMDPPKCLADIAVYDDEFGDKDRLVLIPAGQKKHWHRYGNLLDAFVFEAESDDLNFAMIPEWRPHPGTLYPYIGLMKPNTDKPLGIEKYWVPCYRNHPEHKNAKAWAPWHLWFWIRTVFDLTDAQTTSAFLAAQPGCYRYWS